VPSRGTAATLGAGAALLFSLGAGRAARRFGVGAAARRSEVAADAGVAGEVWDCTGAVDVAVGAGVVTTTFVAAGCASAVGFTAVWAVTGASGVGLDAPVAAARVARSASVDPSTGAEAIRGEASLRGPVGGLSGAGADAAKDGPASARASVAAHAEAHTPLRRSVCRRDDVPVDIRPSLSR